MSTYLRLEEPPDETKGSEMTDSPFKTYEVTTVKTVTVAVITKENIGQIAALIKGKVDYSGDAPTLIEPDRNGGKVWRLGMTIEMFGSSLVNQSGVLTNRDVTNVKEVPDDRH